MIGIEKLRGFASSHSTAASSAVCGTNPSAAAPLSSTNTASVARTIDGVSPVTVQLKKDGSSLCLESTFNAGDVKKNTLTQFNAKR